MSNGFQLPPVMNSIAKGITDSAKNIGNSAKALQEKAGNASEKAGAAPGNAVAKYVDEKSKDMDTIGKAYDKGLVQGVAATFQAMSPGNHYTDILSSIGVDFAPGTKEALSAVINLGTGGPLALPVAFMDLMEAASVGKPSKQPKLGNISRPHTPPPPRDVQPGTPRPGSGRTECPPGYADAGIVAGPTRPGTTSGHLANIVMMMKLEKLFTQLTNILSQFDAKAAEAGSQLDNAGKTDPTKPERELSELEKLPPNAKFEDFIFALLMTVLKDQQADIAAMSDELTEIKKQEKDAKTNEKMAKAFKQVQDTGNGFSKAALGGIPLLGGFISAGTDMQAAASQNGVDVNTEKKTELADSRQELTERIKQMVQKLTEMTQTLSNIMNTMHEGSMNTIRNIK